MKSWAYSTYLIIVSNVLAFAFLAAAVSADPTPSQAQGPTSSPLRWAGAAPMTSVGTSITYQGHLKDGNNPANGSYDLQFTLYDAASGGNIAGGPITLLSQTVTDGLFTVQLDFGPSAFQGSARWLQIAVRQSGGGSYTTLAPLQALTSAPYAMSLVPGAVITGTLAASPAISVSNVGIGGTGVYGSAPTGYGLYGTTANAGGYGVYGSNIAANGVGINGTDNAANGVGVAGNGGIFGVFGSGVDGVYGTTANAGGNGVDGRNTSSGGAGVYGDGNTGVYGQSNDSNGTGVKGEANNGPTAYGVLGTSTGGYGVYGTTTNSATAGVYGLSYGTNGNGVKGEDDTGPTAHGVYGVSSTGAGVYGAGYNGVYGYGSDAGVYAEGGLFGVEGYSPNSYGLYGESDNDDGVYGIGPEGVVGQATGSGVGVSGSGGSYGVSGSGITGVYGESSAVNGPGVYGLNDNNIGVYGSSAGGFGVYGTSSSIGGDGVYGLNNSNIGVYGGGSFGVYGIGTNTGVYGQGSNWAGYFSGSVHVTGQCCAAEQGTYQIDDPLDPANAYLNQAAVQSSEMKDIYDGVATLGADGEATVALPDWFQALNRDFRYQLTAIGAPAPDLYIAQEIQGNSFKIAGGKPGMKVSWQVTGIRQDPYANDHPLQVEQPKPSGEQGTYLYPKGYGQPDSKGVDYEQQKTQQAAQQRPNTLLQPRQPAQPGGK